MTWHPIITGVILGIVLIIMEVVSYKQRTIVPVATAMLITTIWLAAEKIITALGGPK